jgi:hypothetical protein
MTFTPAASASVFFFALILLTVLGSFFAAVYFSNKKMGTNAKKRALVTVGLTILWLVILSGFVTTGIMEARPMPFMMIFFGASNLVALVMALSPVGRWIAANIPIYLLVLFQGFRFPLELVLHSWASQGTIPKTMTWTGSNYDIVTGVYCLLSAYFVRKSTSSAWKANILGFILLLNVMRVAVLSSPLPFSWPLTSPLQLAFHLPYMLIVPVCVAGALAGHVILTRALLMRR